MGVLSAQVDNRAAHGHNRRMSNETDETAQGDALAVVLDSTDPGTGLRAVGALHRLAERVEAMHVEAARRAGWSWEQIGDALGVTRQSVHAKYGRSDRSV
jgi:hypothetical protein